MTTRKDRAADLMVKEFDADNAQPPRRMSEGAVGFDFEAEEIIKETQYSVWYRTGYGVQIPNGYFGDLRARSSVSETGLILANGAGIIDPDYRGEVQFRFYKAASYPHVKKSGMKVRWVERKNSVDLYEPGDRIGQLVIVPQATGQFSGVSVVDDFEDDTTRGEGGFGSTGA